MNVSLFRTISIAFACLAAAGCGGGNSTPTPHATATTTSVGFTGASPTPVATTAPTQTPVATSSPVAASPSPSPGSSNGPSPMPTITPAAPMSASTAIPLSGAGGSGTIPAFGGFSGSFTYPSSDAPSGTTATLTSSTTNLGTLASPANADSIFYEQFSIASSATTIDFSNGNVTGAISSAALLSTKTYTLYIYAIQNGQALSEGTGNIGSPSNGQLAFTVAVGGAFPIGSTLELDFVQN